MLFLHFICRVLASRNRQHLDSREIVVDFTILQLEVNLAQSFRSNAFKGKIAI